MQNIDYKKFLQVLQETKGIHNSLNEILKYDFIYHSNKIEGSTFTTEALQLLFEKNIVKGTHKLDDVQETVNSFYTFDMVIDTLDRKLTLDMIKEWHGGLMYRTSLYDMGLAGIFKKYQNKILGADFETASPLEVEDKLNILINNFNSLEKVTIEDIARFHLEFEVIHPFQDGNGRIGRFIYLKQLLDNRLGLKYMNGESADKYKSALGAASKDDIKPLIQYIEDQYFDRKSSRIKPKDIAAPLCAFANANGGCLAIGVSDDKQIEGFNDIGDDKINDFLKVPYDLCNPTPKYNTEILEINNKKGEPDKVLLFHIESSANKIIKTSSSEVYLRIGDSSKKLSYEDIKNLEYDKGERLYEEELVERSSLEDIDTDLLLEYKKKVNSS